MTDPEQLAGLIGPTMIALGSTEALNMHMFDHHIGPVVYLNGAILFVVGHGWTGSCSALGCSLRLYGMSGLCF